jgi:hypothetical protein
MLASGRGRVASSLEAATDPRRRTRLLGDLACSKVGQRTTGYRRLEVGWD